MRYRTRSVTWQGKAFRFDCLPAPAVADSREWAVSCGLEFIGTMTCRGEVTTGEFDVRCASWLKDLLGRGDRGSGRIDAYGPDGRHGGR